MTYKNFALDLAKKAGFIIRRNFKAGMKKNWKGNDTPVTATDLRINKLVIDSVKKHFPDHGILGEEQSYHPERNILWVCDPVDGTIPFSHGIPTCVFSLALVENGTPILGVIYDPFGDRLVLGLKGKGAFLKSKRMHVSKNKNLRKSVIGVSWHQADIIKHLEDKNAFCVNLCSYVYQAMLVATGEISASFYNYNFAHDCAAAKVIVEEAGGKATDFFGKDQRYDRKVRGQIVSNGHIHSRLVALAKKSGLYGG